MERLESNPFDRLVFPVDGCVCTRVQVVISMNSGYCFIYNIGDYIVVIVATVQTVGSVTCWTVV